MHQMLERASQAYRAGYWAGYEAPLFYYHSRAVYGEQGSFAAHDYREGYKAGWCSRNALAARARRKFV